MILYQVLAFVFLIPGVIAVFGAKKIVEMYKINERTKCDYEREMTEDEIMNYKMTKAIVNVKLYGMLVALPGFIFVLLGFK